VKIYVNATIEALGESEKINETLTQYDYIEFVVEGKIEQVREVFVDDIIHSGLSVGIKADIVIGEFVNYNLTSSATSVTEILALKTSNAERTNYQTVYRQLEKKPTPLGFIPWLLCMPLRGASWANGLIEALFYIYWFTVSAPIIAPFTYIKRYKRHSEFVQSTKDLLTNLDRLNSSIELPKELIETIHQLS